MAYVFNPHHFSHTINDMGEITSSVVMGVDDETKKSIISQFLATSPAIFLEFQNNKKETFARAYWSHIDERVVIADVDGNEIKPETDYHAGDDDDVAGDWMLERYLKNRSQIRYVINSRAEGVAKNTSPQKFFYVQCEPSRDYEFMERLFWIRLRYAMAGLLFNYTF